MRLAVLRIAVLVLIGSSAGWGQGQQRQGPEMRSALPNAIEVVVRTTMGSELHQLARVELIRGDMPMEHNYTNSRGEFAFRGLQEGDYAVRVLVPGYEEQIQEARVEGGGTRRLMFLLRPEVRESEQLSLNDPLVSARMLAAPEKAQELVKKAREQRHGGKYEEAIKSAEAALQAHPNFVLAHAEIGWAHYQMGAMDKAITAFDAAIKSDPKFLNAYINLAEVLSFQGAQQQEAADKQKEFNKAAKVLAAGTKAAPDRGEPYYVMARIQFNSGQLDKAAQAVQLAMTKDVSRVPEVHILASDIYSAKGDDQKALEQLNAYLEKVPKGAQADRARKNAKVFEKKISAKK